MKQVQIALSSPPPVLHCLERIEFIAQEHRERENKKSIYLSHPATEPSHRRTASC